MKRLPPMSEEEKTLRKKLKEIDGRKAMGQGDGINNYLESRHIWFKIQKLKEERQKSI